MMASAVLPGAAGALVDGVGIVVVSFFVLLNTATAVLLIRAMPQLWRHWDLVDERSLASVLTSEALPTLSVVVTGVADRATTIDGVRGLLSLRYPRHEVVLVHDSAASGDLPALVQAFDLYQVPPAVLVRVPTGPVRGYYRSRRHGKLFVIDKERGGRADDLNAALNASRFPYVLTMDVNTWLEPDALLRLMRPFLVGERVAAVAATARIIDEPAPGTGPTERTRVPGRWLPGVQAVERIRESIGRLGWNALGGQLLTGDGVLLHQREHLLDIEGYRNDAGDEALDLVIRLRRHLRAQQLSDAIPVIPDVVAWMRAPGTARAVVSRRGRVLRGQLEVLCANGTLFSRRAGVARLLVPLHVVGVTVVAPLMELVGYLLVVVALVTRGWSDRFIPLFAVTVLGYAALLTLWAVALESASVRRFASWGDVARLSLFAVAEQLGFRQLALWSRLHAAWAALRGEPSGDWERHAVGDAADVPLASPDRTRAS